jgi:hypothetical protein
MILFSFGSSFKDSSRDICRRSSNWDTTMNEECPNVIQVDIGGHPPSPTGPKHFLAILVIYYF